MEPAATLQPYAAERVRLLSTTYRHAEYQGLRGHGGLAFRCPAWNLSCASGSLGERRALAAREALAKEGVDPSRIRTISYGKDKPVDPANNEAAWSKNRRDDFILLHPKPGV